METFYAVIDTNVLVSGLLSPNGHPGRIMEMLRAGEVTAVLDDRILREYSEVLKRPEFAFPKAEVDILLRHIVSYAQHADVDSRSMVMQMDDQGDIPFAECALSFACPIVTGNVRHFKGIDQGRTPVLNPAEFIEYILRSR